MSSAELLRRLLDAWGASRDPELERAITQIGAERARDRPPIAAAADLEAHWLAIAASCDPGDVDRLLAAPWPEDWTAALPRVAALAWFRADPRIALGLVEVAKRYPGRKSLAFHYAVARILEKTPFAALVTALEPEALRELKQPWVYAHARELAAEVTVRFADPALVAEAYGGGSSEAVASLGALHAADPHDHGLRDVLADALLEVRDPRGELIALQTAIADGRGTPESEARVDVLLRAYGHAWIDGLPTRPELCRFERGFVVAARVQLWRPDLARSCELPAWRTIEELVLDHIAEELGPLLHRMPRLRVLVARMADYRATYTPTDGPFPTIRALGLGSAALPADLTMFPGLRVLSGAWEAAGLRIIDRDGLRALHARAAALGIEALVSCGVEVSALRTVILDRAGGPPELRFAFTAHGGFDANGWCVWLPREGTRARVGWDGRPAVLDAGTERDLSTILEAFASTGITHVVASLAPAAREIFEPAIARKLADIARRVRAGKSLAPIELTYDAARIDLTASSG